MKVGLFQYDIAWEDKSANISKIRSILKASSSKDVDWIVFPEMSLTGFSMDPSKTMLEDADIAFFKDVAKERSSYVSFGAVVEGKNTAVTISPTGELVNKYSKAHLFGYGNETAHYKAGEDPSPFIVNGMNAVPAICYDLRFSYLFWDLAAQTELFFVMASWPKSRRDHWLSLLKARAIENQAYVIGVNRIGLGGQLEYSGDSVVYSPFGEELLNCRDGEGLFAVEISKDEVLRIRREYPFLSDRKK